MNAEFWKGRKVLLAPAQGELATWVLLLLNKLQAEVTLAAELTESPSFFDYINGAELGNLFLGSFQDQQFWRTCFEPSAAEVVLFLPGDSLQQNSSGFSDFFNSQVLIQTAILEAFEGSAAKMLVWQSSDRVYAKSEGNTPLTEESPLYPENSEASKMMMGEVLVNAYREKFFKPEKFNKHEKAAIILRQSSGFGATLKGGGLLADCANALNAGRDFEIKKPLSVRPWVHYLDQAHSVLLATEYLSLKGPKAAKVVNVGAEEYEAVGEVIREFAETWSKKSSARVKNLNARSGLSLHRQLSSELASNEFGWMVHLSLSKGLKATADWYREYLTGQDSLNHLNELVDYFFKETRKKVGTQ